MRAEQKVDCVQRRVCLSVGAVPLRLDGRSSRGHAYLASACRPHDHDAEFAHLDCGVGGSVDCLAGWLSVYCRQGGRSDNISISTPIFWPGRNATAWRIPAPPSMDMDPPPLSQRPLHTLSNRRALGMGPLKTSATWRDPAVVAEWSHNLEHSMHLSPLDPLQHIVS